MTKQIFHVVRGNWKEIMNEMVIACDLSGATYDQGKIVIYHSSKVSVPRTLIGMVVASIG